VAHLEELLLLARDAIVYAHNDKGRLIGECDAFARRG